MDVARIRSVVTTASPLLPPNGAVTSSPAPQALGIIPEVATAVGCIVHASSPSSNAIDRPAPLMGGSDLLAIQRWGCRVIVCVHAEGMVDTQALTHTVDVDRGGGGPRREGQMQKLARFQICLLESQASHLRSTCTRIVFEQARW